MFSTAWQELQTQGAIARCHPPRANESHPPVSVHPTHPGRLLPLLCASDHGARHTCRLIEALQRAGHSTELRAGHEVSWDASPATRRTAAEDIQGQPLHFVLPVLDRSAAALAAASSIALLVSTQLAGLREAYRLIQHYSQASSHRIGIILMDSPDRRSAWIHFRKLAMESRRFLDVPLVNLGCLATDPDDHSPMVAARIVHNRFFLPYAGAAGQPD